MGTKELPKPESLVEYGHAVAGHPGPLCDLDGELFIKPCVQGEINFYQTAADLHPDFADIMPLFMGTLMLSDATTVADINQQLPAVAGHIGQDVKEKVAGLAHGAPAPVDAVTWTPSGGVKITTDRAVVLENLAYGYKQPNIMDVKLGQRLWADSAPLQKRARLDRIRTETTHEKYGFRIAGMRVFHGSDDAAQLDKEGYKIYNKNWGQLEVNNDNVADALRKFIFNESAGIDEEIGRAIARAYKTDLERIRDVLETERTRMYSSSLLFVFEGEGSALKAAIEETSSSAAESEKGKGGGDSCRSNFRVDSGIDMDEDGELIPPPAEDGGDGDGGGDDEDANVPRIYSVKLIDFAHARFVPEEDQPDENVLLGVRSLINIFDEMSR